MVFCAADSYKVGLCCTAVMTKRQESQHSPRVDHATASQTKTWIDRELVGSEFRDARLRKRFRKLFEQLSDGIGERGRRW